MTKYIYVSDFDPGGLDLQESDQQHLHLNKSGQQRLHLNESDQQDLNLNESDQQGFHSTASRLAQTLKVPFYLLLNIVLLYSINILTQQLTE